MEEEFYKVGHIAKLYRVHGKVVIAFNTLRAEEVRDIRFWFLPMVKKPVPFYVEEAEVEEEDTLIVKFEDIDSRDEARPLLKKGVYLPKSQLQEVEAPDTFITLLPGYKVVDAEKGEIGEIEEVQSYPEQYLARIHYRGKEVLLPLNDDTIRSVDEEQEILYYNTPKGLLEL